jgi:hypothetical protein
MGVTPQEAAISAMAKEFQVRLGQPSAAFGASAGQHPRQAAR